MEISLPQFVYMSSICCNYLPCIFVCGRINTYLLIAKSATLEEAFDYPLTTVLLSIAETTTDLRSSDKAGFRNHVLKECDAISTAYPIDAKWIIDGMAVVRSVKPKSTYLDYFHNLLKSILPPIPNLGRHLLKLSWIIILSTVLKSALGESAANKVHVCISLVLDKG